MTVLSTRDSKKPHVKLRKSTILENAYEYYLPRRIKKKEKKKSNVVEEGEELSNEVDIFGRGVLWRVVAQGDLKKLVYLVEEKKYKVGGMDSVGVGLIDVALYFGHNDVVDYLQKRGVTSMNIVDSHYRDHRERASSNAKSSPVPVDVYGMIGIFSSTSDATWCRRAKKRGFENPDMHIAFRNKYHDWLQMMKAFSLRYDLKTLTSEILLKTVCERLFLDPFLQQMKNIEVESKRGRSLNKLLFETISKEFNEKFGFRGFALKRKSSRAEGLKEIVSVGVVVVVLHFNLKPVGRFLWPVSGTDFDMEIHEFKNKKSDGLKATTKNMVIKTCL